LRCDCGSQLKAALAAIAREKHGVLLYLNQEGRGIGLANKLRAYRLQEAGLDTVDANLALGFAEDERDFAVASQMLKALKIPKIRLLTNNPGKLKSLEGAGVKIAERVPLKVSPGAHNRKYLEAKAAKMGHQY
jgi:GTP cyclohydrolase II